MALIVKRWALEAGFDPALFRRPFLALRARHGGGKGGQERAVVMKQTGHRSVTVVRRYIRDAELFDDHSAAGIGL